MDAKCVEDDSKEEDEGEVEKNTTEKHKKYIIPSSC